VPAGGVMSGASTTRVSATEDSVWLNRVTESRDPTGRLPLGLIIILRSWELRLAVLPTFGVWANIAI
jgi:hypothetical protein